MIYGVEQSTDMRDQRTKIVKFSSRKKALEWKQNSGDYTYLDPELAQNYHRTFRYLYEYYGRINKKDSIFERTGTPTYPCCYEDNLASYLWQYGTKIETA